MLHRMKYNSNKYYEVQLKPHLHVKRTYFTGLEFMIQVNPRSPIFIFTNGELFCVVSIKPWFPLYQAHNAVTKLSFAKFSGARKTHGCGLVIYGLFFV